MKIFYFMHLPWGWIKQRPHFLAEELNNFFRVRVFIPKFYRTPLLTKNNTKLCIKNIFRFPLERFAFFLELNKLLINIQLRYLYGINEYDYVWITDLRLYSYIKKVISNKQILIYDCMDDTLEFHSLKNQYDKLKRIEEQLLIRSDVVFFSSNELKNRKMDEYNLPHEKCEVIYNAIDNNFLKTDIYDQYDYIFEKYHSKGYNILTYIGTISDWFDFEVLEMSLVDFNNIIYFTFGIKEDNIILPKNERIIHFGPVEHEYLKSIILKSDLLIMPFKVNKLVKAVDPVKLYEYIALGKEIISIWYEELEKFSGYVNFYISYNDFKEKLYLVLNSLSGKGYNLNNDFANKNSWNKRAVDIVSKLRSVYKTV